MILHFKGGETVCKQNISSPCQLMHTALQGCAQHSHTKQCGYNEALGHSPMYNSTQLTL
ncbi:unnamed protein product [Staurois parvus]|uniref:Uncharacterized protein n=1 Tax=Staurois parvus TaxID=386267 RepID=A0ABN9D2J9_9NEOB|nr:unnamed protein product [Staurois parvus]